MFKGAADVEIDLKGEEMDLVSALPKSAPVPGVNNSTANDGDTIYYDALSRAGTRDSMATTTGETMYWDSATKFDPDEQSGGDDDDEGGFRGRSLDIPRVLKPAVDDPSTERLPKRPFLSTQKENFSPRKPDLDDLIKSALPFPSVDQRLPKRPTVQSAPKENPSAPRRPDLDDLIKSAIPNPSVDQRLPKRPSVQSAPKEFPAAPRQPAVDDPKISVSPDRPEERLPKRPVPSYPKEYPKASKIPALDEYIPSAVPNPSVDQKLPKQPAPPVQSQPKEYPKAPQKSQIPSPSFPLLEPIIADKTNTKPTETTAQPIMPQRSPLQSKPPEGPNAVPPNEPETGPPPPPRRQRSLPTGDKIAPPLPKASVPTRPTAMLHNPPVKKVPSLAQLDPDDDLGDTTSGSGSYTSSSESESGSSSSTYTGSTVTAAQSISIPPPDDVPDARPPGNRYLPAVGLPESPIQMQSGAVTPEQWQHSGSRVRIPPLRDGSLRSLKRSTGSENLSGISSGLDNPAFDSHAPSVEDPGSKNNVTWARSHKVQLTDPRPGPTSRGKWPWQDRRRRWFIPLFIGIGVLLVVGILLAGILGSRSN